MKEEIEELFKLFEKIGKLSMTNDENMQLQIRAYDSFQKTHELYDAYYSQYYDTKGLEKLKP